MSYANTENKKYQGNRGNTDLEYKLNLKLLALGGFLILGSAAVVTALYLPEHMPTVIENVVNKLIPAYFYMILGGSILGAGLGLGCLAYERRKYNLSLFPSLNEEHFIKLHQNSASSKNGHKGLIQDDQNLEEGDWSSVSSDAAQKL